MGAFNSTPQTETINWKNINTNDMSEIPNLYGISAEANKLVEQLNLPPLSESTSNSTNIDNYFLSKVNNSTNNQLSENLSSTSPFISSEMYNFVMDKYQKQHNINGSKNSMIGGSKNSLDDDSDTSSTSSSKSSESEKKPVHKEKNKSAKNKIVNRKVQKKATEDFMEYLSSSAHTGGSITESSVLNENTISVSSVRTSQINLISE